MIRIGGIAIAVLLLVSACSGSDSVSTPATVLDATIATEQPTSATADAIATEPTTLPPAATTTVAQVPPATDVILLTDDDPPPFPVFVSGYEPDGPVSTQQFRMFSGQPVTTLGFGSSAGGCFRGYWIVRWRSVGGPVKANVSGYIGDEGMAASDLPPVEAGLRGYMAGSLCSQPVFYSDESLVDVVAEYQAYSPTVDTSSGPDPSTPATATTVAPESKAYACGGYTPAFDLPLKPCDTAITVIYVQNRLSELGYNVDTDGDFGYATQVAVLQYQASQGLEPDGLVGRLTWIALMTGYGLPGFDENGDGVIFPDELGE